MSEPAMVVRNISDTARWAAVFRANETQRPDALFRDPYAARLAGALGVDIANTLPEGNSYAWAWVSRTYQEGILAGEKPTCRLERIRLDLSDVEARKPVFAELAGRAGKIIVLTEGLLIYLEPSQVIALAKGLAGSSQFQRWILDLHSPGLLRRMQRTTGKQLSQVGAPFKFGPPEGPQFLGPYGWG